MHSDKPSRTAYKVSMNIVTLGAKPGIERILPEHTVRSTKELLIASGVVGERTVRWTQSRLMVSVYDSFDWMLPGQFEAFAHRKAFCEQQVREGIDTGATQILVLGAGYDTMGWRLAPEFSDVNFFEIDHPATAHFKARGIEVMGQQDNLCLIAEDLSKRKLVDILCALELWDKSARTVIVAEGLLMYLPSEAVKDLFWQCATITGNGSRIAFSYIPTGADEEPYVGRWTRLMLWLQKAIGEPWIWSIRPEELDLFLVEAGWENAPELINIPVKAGVEYLGVAKR